MMSAYTFGWAGYGAFNGDGTVFDTPREIPVDMPDNDPSLYPDAHGFTAVKLPYKGGKLFMVIVVPQSANGLGEFEQEAAEHGPETLDHRNLRSDGDRERAQVQAENRVFAGEVVRGAWAWCGPSTSRAAQTAPSSTA